METDNINREIDIKTTLWLIYDTEEKAKMLSCKADWNRYKTDSPMITFFQLQKDGLICITNTTSADYCRERFEIDETRSWKISNHRDIEKLLKKYMCYEPEYYN